MKKYKQIDISEASRGARRSVADQSWLATDLAACAYDIRYGYRVLVQRFRGGKPAR